MGRKILSKKYKKNKLTSQTGGMPTADVNNVFVINAHGTQCLFDEGSYYFTMPEGLQVINFGEFGSIEQVSGMKKLLPNLVKNPILREQFITANRRDEALDYLKKHPMKRMERGDIIHEPIIKHYYKKHKGVEELKNFTTEEYRKNEKIELWNKMRENAAPDIKLYFSDPKYKGIGIYRVHENSVIPLLSKRSDVKQKISYDSSIKFDPLLSRDPIYRDLVGSEEEWNIKLYEYLQLQTVPDNFPIAKHANLFFMLNPDNFVVNELGPDVMTYSHVEIDPKISEIVPELSEIYQRWLLPIQSHHAAFSTMEGIAEFAVQNILQDDDDFQNYLTTFMGTDFSSYKVRKNMGKELTEKVFNKFGKDAFRFLIEKPPSTRELKEPELYLKRDLSTGSKHM